MPPFVTREIGDELNEVQCSKKRNVNNSIELASIYTEENKIIIMIIINI